MSRWRYRRSDRLEQEQGSAVDYFHANQYLAMAFVTAVEGNTPETERLVRVWLREATQDHAELAGLRHHACRALALARRTRFGVSTHRRTPCEYRKRVTEQ